MVVQQHGRAVNGKISLFILSHPLFVAMIEIFAPASAAKGVPFSGSFRISGDDALQLSKSRGVAVNFSCIISSKDYRLQAVKNSARTVGQLAMAAKAAFAFPLKKVWTQEAKFPASQSGSFSFTPDMDAPETYDGKIIAVQWIIECKIDMPLAIDKNEFLEVVVK